VQSTTEAPLGARFGCAKAASLPQRGAFAKGPLQTNELHHGALELAFVPFASAGKCTIGQRERLEIESVLSLFDEPRQRFTFVARKVFVRERGSQESEVVMITEALGQRIEQLLAHPHPLRGKTMQQVCMVPNVFHTLAPFVTNLVVPLAFRGGEALPRFAIGTTRCSDERRPIEIAECPLARTLSHGEKHSVDALERGFEALRIDVTGASRKPSG